MHKIRLQFPLGITLVPRESENKETSVWGGRVGGVGKQGVLWALR